VLAVWDWEIIVSAGSDADGKRIGTSTSPPPSRLVSIAAPTEELEVLLDPVGSLCHIDSRCRVVLCSRRTILIFDVARNVELFRLTMSLGAPAVGPFYRSTWNGVHLVTLELVRKAVANRRLR
jgi:hypothetical protein